LTTSITPRTRLLRHIVPLVAWLVARLVVEYFAFAARPGTSARRAACHATRRRLFRLRRASGCFGTSRGTSHRSSSTTSPYAGSSSTTSPTLRVRVPRHVARLVVDYFDYAACPVASAHCAAHRAARRRLLRLRRTSGYLGTSRGSSCDSSSTSSTMPRVGLLRHVRGTSHRSSRGSSSTTSPRAGSSSTTSPTLCVRVPRHVARLVSPLVVDYFASCRLVVDYFAYAARPGASARRAARLAARRQLLHLVQACH
jgi:hypothetical protein